MDTSVQLSHWTKHRTALCQPVQSLVILSMPPHWNSSRYGASSSLPFLLALVLVWPHSVPGQRAKTVNLTLQKKCRPFPRSLSLRSGLVSAQEEVKRSHLRYRDEHIGIPAALAQTANHWETAPTDFLWSLDTNRIEQLFRVRNNRNFRTLLNKGIWHHLHLADPTSKRAARGTNLAEQTNGVPWHCEMLSP